MEFLVQPVQRNQVYLFAAVAFKFKAAVGQLKQKFAAVAAFFLVLVGFDIRHNLAYFNLQNVIICEISCQSLFKISCISTYFKWKIQGQAGFF